MIFSSGSIDLSPVVVSGNGARAEVNVIFGSGTCTSTRHPRAGDHDIGLRHGGSAGRTLGGVRGDGVQDSRLQGQRTGPGDPRHGCVRQAVDRSLRRFQEKGFHEGQRRFAVPQPHSIREMVDGFRADRLSNFPRLKMKRADGY